MEKIREIVLEILRLIDFLNNKQIFAEKFVNLCITKTVAELMDGLTPTTKSELAAKFEGIESIENRMILAKSHFTQKEINDKFSEVSRRMITEWLKHIKNSLNPSQINALEKYLTTVL